MAFTTQEIVLFSKEEKNAIKQDIIDSFNGASATPIASLSVLQSTYPNGANGIYVALDSGLWYGWNGSSWVSGGTYISSDAMSNKPSYDTTKGSGADTIVQLHPGNNPNDNLYPNIKRENIPFDITINKNAVQPYGELTSLDLNTIRESCVYKFNGSAIVNGPSNLDTSKDYLLTSYRLKFLDTQDVIYQELRSLDGTMIYNRQYISGSWYGWNKFELLTKDNYVLIKNAVQPYGELQTLDINTITDSSVYKINGSAIVNAPSDLDTSKEYLLTSYKLKFLDTQDVIYQELRSLDGTMIYNRQYISGSWYGWNKFELLTKDNYVLIKNLVHPYGVLQTLDLNTITDASVYMMSGSAIVNAPSGIVDNKVYMITTYKLKFTSTSDYVHQEIRDVGNTITFYRAYQNGVWYGWSIQQSTRNKIEIGVGRQFTSIVDGFAKAFALGNCDVYIYGTFDLMNESEEFYTTTKGLKIGNNNRYFFSPDSKIIFNYTGNNEFTLTEFSPLNNGAGDGSFELYGLNIEASRCRYCVHDDYGGPFNGQYVYHLYDNCNMYMDNTNNNVWATKRCIGGGLTNNVKIEIRNSIFNSLNGVDDANYHTNWNTSILNSNQEIIVINSYFTHNFTFTKIGATEKGTILLNNNVLSSELSQIDGFTIKQWNNVLSR